MSATGDKQERPPKKQFPPTPDMRPEWEIPAEGGIVVVDKEAGWTSHDVVARARRLLRTKKVGHSGTLDPDATGVMVLGVGRSTRLLTYLTGLGKSYVGEIALGIETDTLDVAGQVTATHDMSAVTLAEVVAATAQFVGDIEQVPPMVSAIKIDGKRLHELAREGKVVERKPRPVTVSRFDIEPVEGETGVYRAFVDCSSGTYIRTLAADLGTALGGGAHLRSLRRTAVGPFALEQARPLEDIVVQPALDGVPHLARIDASDDLAVDVRFGKVLERDRLGAHGDGPWAVVDAAGVLIAVYVAHKGTTAKPALVLAG